MKIHLRDTKARAEDWEQSPHVERAIEEGILAVCGVIADEEHITEDLGLVECKACLMEAQDEIS